MRPMTTKGRPCRQPDVGQDDGERRHAEDRDPDDVLPAEAVAEVAPEDRSDGDRRQEDEEQVLRPLG